LAGYNIWLFILCSIEGARRAFFVVAILLNRWRLTRRLKNGWHVGGHRS